ncbi:MAG: cytochrome ubiquinol oxidase subunit I [Propionibacteriaceae bacterium]|jgi:cytochrome d ubiquinol oxidase subunit I|nr:cytochrome ubiquinol oxidase subunit I [Propionibacteriaceae bacterium]
MSPEILARWQFGVTTVYHFLFVPLTISLSLVTAVLQTVWNRTGNAAYLRLTKFFGKLFLINFAMGVVTGIVQEFQFGMNWSEYSRFVGDIFGAPLALEALIAFFLESTFLGIWIFGWGRLSKGKHLAMIWLAAVGTLLSSIFIIAANAWMQNPVGAKLVGGHAELDGFGGFVEVLLNPVFLTQWPHTIAAAFVTGGAFMAAVAFYRLIKANKEGQPNDVPVYRKAIKIGAWVMIVAGLGSVVTGDLLGKEMVQTQPTKMSAAEGLTEDPPVGEAGFQVLPGVELFPGFLNWLYGTDYIQGTDALQAQWEEQGYRQQSYYDCMQDSSMDCTEMEILGQNKLQEEFADGLSEMTGYAGYESDEALNPDGQTFNVIPSLGVSFWSFRLMIAVGMLSVLIGLILLIVTRGDKTPKGGPLTTAVAVVLPLLPLIANSFGWIFTEMGRQPWIVNGVLPTVYAISPAPTLAHSTAILALTLILYTLLYAVLAVIEVRLMLKYIKIGLPPDEDVQPVDLDADADAPLSFAY